MVNRNFINRTTKNRLKTIRDRKKGPTVGAIRRERKAGHDRRFEEVDINKKEKKKQNNLRKIYKEAGIDESFLKRKYSKKNRKSAHERTTKQEMNKIEKLDIEMN